MRENSFIKPITSFYEYMIFFDIREATRCPRRHTMQSANCHNLI